MTKQAVQGEGNQISSIGILFSNNCRDCDGAHGIMVTDAQSRNIEHKLKLNDYTRSLFILSYHFSSSNVQCEYVLQVKMQVIIHNVTSPPLRELFRLFYFTL